MVENEWKRSHSHDFGECVYSNQCWIDGALTVISQNINQIWIDCDYQIIIKWVRGNRNDNSISSRAMFSYNWHAFIFKSLSVADHIFCYCFDEHHNTKEKYELCLHTLNCLKYSESTVVTFVHGNALMILLITDKFRKSTIASLPKWDEKVCAPNAILFVSYF